MFSLHDERVAATRSPVLLLDNILMISGKLVFNFFCGESGVPDNLHEGVRGPNLLYPYHSKCAVHHVA